MTREEAIARIKDHKVVHKMNEPRAIYISEALDMAIRALEQEPCEDMGEVSDGYHTFNQLYHQRAILFATIVNQNTDIAWKSFKHSDGKYCFDSDGKWFIVGVDTPEGSYTYHYEKKYWDMFNCKELECGKEWDGHTEEDVTRLLSLQPKTGQWIEEDVFDGDVAYRCSECDELFWHESGTPKDNEYNFCPKCGASMEDEE